MTTDATPPAGDAPAATPATPAENSTPLAGNENATPAAAPAVTPEVQALIDEAARKASQDANREAQALRKRTKELEDAEQKRQDAELSDTERLTKERDEAAKQAAAAQQTAQAAVLRAEVAAKAAALNIVDPDAALVLMARDGIEFDGDKVTGVEDALAALVASKPFLVATPGTPQLDPTNGARQHGGATPAVSDAERLAALRNPSAGNPFARRS